MAMSTTDPAPRPCERAYDLVLFPPPDWTDAETAEAIRAAVARLQEAAHFPTGRSREVPAVRVRPLPAA